MSGEKAKGRTDDHYRRIYALFLPVFRIVARATYGVRVKKPRHYDEPVLILANHTSDMDFVVVASHISNRGQRTRDGHGPVRQGLQGLVRPHNGD